MKKVILLLLALYSNNFVFAQYQIGQGALVTAFNADRKSLENVYTSFEDAIFTQSDKKGIFVSYINLGKSHKDLGHLEEASSFFKRAYVLAKEYYRSFPDEKNLLKLIEGHFESMLLPFPKMKEDKLNDVSNNVWERPTADSVRAMPYLQQAKQVLTIKDNEAFLTNTSQTINGTEEQKIVSSFFMAITEPVESNSYTLRKRTSLRQAATHKSHSLRRLAIGSKITVLEKTNKYWWKVNIDGMIGYVKAMLLRYES